MCRKRTKPYSSKTSSRKPHLESLERRDLLSVDVVPGCYTSLGDDQLQIIATDGPDEVWVFMSPTRDSILVYENGRLHDVREPFDHIYFEGRGGEDRFINATSIPSIADGGAGNDRLYGGLSVNTLIGGDGSDELYGRGSHDQIWGDSVTDEETLRDLPEGYVGGTSPGNDTIEGGPTVNLIYAGPGDDTVHINGETGNLVYGGAGNDIIFGSIGIDHIDCGPGNDLARGGAGADFIIGGAGNDIVLGESGNDIVLGGDGRDLVIGGSGKDIVCGSRFDARDPLGRRGYEPGDILIEDTTDYDANDDALMAILNEWIQPTSLETRVRNLQRGVGPLGIYALNDRTVHDDGAADRLPSTGDGDWVVGDDISPLLRPLY